MIASNVRLRPDQDAELKVRAKRNGVTPSDVMREALDYYFDGELPMSKAKKGTQA
jgi:hypothetical protein